MEDIVDYSADPLEGISIWTHPHSSPACVFSFDCELSEAVEALPSISGPKSLVITLQEIIPTLPDLTDQPLFPFTLQFVDHPPNPSNETLIAGPGSFPP